METIKYKGFSIKVKQDENAENPIKNWDGNAKYALFHNRYNFQNDTDLNPDDYNNWGEFKDALIKKYKPLVVLPVYLYDHSGLTISTSPFSNKWDSGQLGFAFIDKPTLKSWGYDSEADYNEFAKQTLEEALISNVSLYDDFISGNVWQYLVTNPKGDVIDSCSGYYGDIGREEAVKEAKSVIDFEISKKPNSELTNLKTIVSEITGRKDYPTYENLSNEELTKELRSNFWETEAVKLDNEKIYVEGDDYSDVFRIIGVNLA